MLLVLLTPVQRKRAGFLYIAIQLCSCLRLVEAIAMVQHALRNIIRRFAPYPGCGKVMKHGKTCAADGCN